MAVRNSTEHSYRSLAIQTLYESIKTKLMEATVKMERFQFAYSGNEDEQIAHEKLKRETLTEVLVLASEISDKRKAASWLYGLDEQLCPEVQPVLAQMEEALTKGSEADFMAIIAKYLT